MNRHVLITGSSGFVGSNLIGFLQQKKFSVIGLDCCPSKFVEPNYFIKTDIRDENTLREILKECKPCAVFHLAAISTIQQGQSNPQETWSVNFGGTRALLDAVNLARLNNTKIFFASTDKVYGVLPTGADSYTEEMPLCPINTSPYDCSKAAADQLVQTTNNTYVLRFCNLYGPYDSFRWEKSHVMAALIRKSVERMDPFEVWGDGKDYKDFIYIDDLVRGVCLALSVCEGFQIYNIASGENHTINEVLEIILEETDYTDANVQYNTSKPMMIPYKRMSIEKARKVLGFEPQVSIREGIRRTVDWYRAEGYKTV